jgi:hypothetical protein
VNKAGAQSGLPSCSKLTELPLLQDDSTGSLWAALGIWTNSLIVVDPAGKLVLVLVGGNLPTSGPEIEGAVNGLLN